MKNANYFSVSWVYEKYRKGRDSYEHATIYISKYCAIFFALYNPACQLFGNKKNVHNINSCLPAPGTFAKNCIKEKYTRSSNRLNI